MLGLHLDYMTWGHLFETLQGCSVYWETGGESEGNEGGYGQNDQEHERFVRTESVNDSGHPPVEDESSPWLG